MRQYRIFIVFCSECKSQFEAKLRVDEDGNCDRDTDELLCDNCCDYPTKEDVDWESMDEGFD